MAYPIPSAIAYEEKMAFNLTAKQLGYAVASGFTALQSYNLLNPIAPQPFSIIPSIALGTLGIGFMYLGLEDRLKDFLAYHSNVRSGGYFDRKVRAFVEIESVDDDTISLKNGEMRAVLQIVPLNFVMFDEQRKKAVTQAFGAFLQQLEQPIQFHARTVNIELADYFDRHESKVMMRDKSLLPLYKDFRAYEEKMIRENAIRNRLFYAVIPMNDKGKDRSKRLELLEKKVRVIQEGLAEAGIVSERVDTERLVALVSSYFEERLALGGDYLSRRTVLANYADVVVEEKGDTEELRKFRKRLLQDLICPSRIETKPDHIKVNETFYRIIMGSGYPKEVDSGWIEKLISTRDDYDISIHIEPTSIEATKVMLHNQIIKEQADYTIATMKGMPNPSLANKLSDTKEFFNWLDRGQERLFNVSIYVMCKAHSMDQLDYLTDKCKADLNSVSIIPKIPYYRMAQGMQSVIPLGTDKMRKSREFPTSALAATFPFISSTPEIEHEGILLAHDRNNGNPIIRDLGNLTNLHFMILAKSGSGKSYTAKLLITRMLMDGTKVFIVDPSGEYIRMCEHYGGQVIKISRDSETIINPLDLFGEKFADKRISLMGLFSIISGGLSPSFEGSLDKALKETYWRNGISEDVSDEDIAKIQPPKMSHLLAVLNEQLGEAQKYRMYDNKRTLQALVTRIEKYCKGGVYSFVDRQTNMDANQPFIVFDIKDLPDEVKPMYMYLILDFITNRAKEDLERKSIVIDEGWSLLNQEKSAEHLLWLIKSSRKFNTGMTFITQEVNDLIGSKVGESILANAATKILLAQDSATITALGEVLHLNMKERNFLVTAKKGDGLLVLENTIRVPVSIKASPKEHELITTHPDEVKMIEMKAAANDNATTESIAEPPALDLTKPMYKASDLPREAVEKLRNEGYDLVKRNPYGSGGNVKWLVKTRKNEGPDHALFVRVIESEIRKYTDKIEVFEVANPDLVFDCPIGKVAVEVETGLRKDSAEQMRMRFERLKSEHADVLVLVSDKYLKDDYGEYAKTITRTQIQDAIKSYFENGAIGGGKNGC